MTDSPTEPIEVLHVDDDEDFLEVAAGFLRQGDGAFAVTTVTNASDGLAHLAETDVDCVVSDYRMSGMDGLEFLAAVREDHPSLPFILFTGQGSEEIASDAISAGVTDYIKKGTGTGRYALLRKRVENAVQKRRANQQRRRHLQALETAREGISFLDPEGRFTYVNQAYADLYGYDVDELVGRHWEVLYPEEEAERVREEILPELESAGRWRGETVGRRADGETFVEDHSLALTDDEMMVCIVREMTDRKERERDLEMYEAAVEAARDGITVLDANGTYQMVNSVFCEVVGLPREEILGKDPTYLVERGVIDESAVETGVEKVLECLTGDAEQITFETTVESPTFGEEIVEHNLALVTSEDDEGHLDAGDPADELPLPMEVDLGAIDGAVMTHRKISERKRREEALQARERELKRQNERLEEFASVVSHDLRNPLTVAIAGLDLLQEECDSEHTARVEEAHSRMNRIIGDLLTLARQGESVSEVSVVESAQLVHSAWETVDTPNAEIRVDWDVPIEADPGRLRQLFENLFRNAIEHAGDDVTVRVGPLEASSGFYVEDDGPGIPEDERDRVTEPGYSTSEEGTGLGLNIVTDIAEAHGWDVRVTEGEDGGARFELTGVEVAGRSGGGQAGHVAE